MPTPRPERLVTTWLVEKPGRKINSSNCISLSFLASSKLTNFLSTAFWRTASNLIPPPSSAISITTMPFSWIARSKTLPFSGLPLAKRSAGSSIPWSTLLRIIWISGSRMPSSKVRSSSVSAPSWMRVTFLRQSLAISRTKRGNFAQTCEIGCMRVFIMRSCSSKVSKSIDLTVFEKLWSPNSAVKGSKRLRASTISLTKFINLSSNSKLTFTGAATSVVRALPVGAAASTTISVSVATRLSPIKASSVASISSDSIASRTKSSVVWAVSKGGIEGCDVGMASRLLLLLTSPPFARLSKSAISRASSPAGSVLATSMPLIISRKASSAMSRVLVFWVSSAKCPSRIFPNRLSPACETFSRRLKAKNPLLPFSVCMARKILPTSFLSSGVSSSWTKSKSSWSRISLASIINSARMSSLLSMDKA